MLETKQISIGDATLSYNEVPGTGRPLVLLHGLTGHRDDFRKQMPELADTGWVLAPDLRGHGDFTHTGRRQTFNFDQLVCDVRDALDALGIDRIDLLGHSFGGMISLRFVLTHPDRVASLVLMDTAPCAPEGYTTQTFEKAGAIAEARGMEFLQALVERASRNNPNPSPSDRQTHKWAAHYWTHHRLRYTSMDPVGYGALGTLMVEQSPVVTRLREISCPTTIVVGDQDTEFLPGADSMTSGITGAVRVTLKDAGHHPHMESPKAWMKTLRDHLKRARNSSE